MGDRAGHFLFHLFSETPQWIGSVQWTNSSVRIYDISEFWRKKT